MIKSKNIVTAHALTVLKRNKQVGYFEGEWNNGREYLMTHRQNAMLYSLTECIAAGSLRIRFITNRQFLAKENDMKRNMRILMSIMASVIYIAVHSFRRQQLKMPQRKKWQ